MLFTSLEFLFAFLPVALAVNFLLPKKLRNYWLLLASLFFYAWGEPRFVLAMLLSILMNDLMARWIHRVSLPAEDGPQRVRALRVRKALLTAAILLNLSLLFLFKYTNFATATLRAWFPMLKDTVPQTSFVLPIGISFFTFQAMSYVIDVYRGVPLQRNIANVGLYISLFPQLIAGPIVRYTTVAEELKHRTVTFEGFSQGVLRFLYGFNKKMLLANILAKAADAAFASSTLSTGMAWLGMVCYTLQIFFDFAGYSEMAIGLGQMLGFRFPENFHDPYISKTVTEFWRRWHISLGSWFKDYLYFPLGGSRVSSRLRLVFNLAVVWLATGIWHGANWTFLLWGVWHGAIIIVEKLLELPRRLPQSRAASAVYQGFTLLAVMLGWVLFRAEDLGAALYYLKALFGLGGAGLFCDTAAFYLREYLVPLAVGILCSTPIFRRLRERLEQRGDRAAFCAQLAAGTVQLLLFLVGVSYLVINAHNPFIYFNF